MTRSAAGKLLNFLAFQAGWWTCILGAAQDRAWLGPAVVGGVIVAHLAVTRRRGEIALVLFAVLLGLVLDGGLAAAGLLVFEPVDGPFVGALPVWMVALWANFAPTLGHSLGWLRRRWWLAAAFGLLGGPSTYWAGTRLGALTFGEHGWGAVVGVGVVWTLALPALLLATERLLPRDPE